MYFSASAEAKKAPAAEAAEARRPGREGRASFAGSVSPAAGMRCDADRHGMIDHNRPLPRRWRRFQRCLFLGVDVAVQVDVAATAIDDGAVAREHLEAAHRV